MTNAKQPNHLREAINKMADGMHRLAIMDEPTYRKVTACELGATPLPTAEPITGEEIRRLREQAHLSQAARGISASRPVMFRSSSAAPSRPRDRRSPC